MIKSVKNFLSHANLNIKGTFLEKKNVVFLIVAIGLMAFGYSFRYDWGNTTYKAIGAVDIGVIFLNTIVIGIFRSPKSYRSYLIYNLIYRFVYMVLVLLTRDISEIADKLGITNTSKLDEIVYSIKPLVQLGFASANVIILPFFMFMAAISMIEASWTIRLVKGSSRMTVFILFSVVIIAFMPSIMEGIQSAQEYIADKFFNSAFHGALAINSKIYTFLSHLSFILWFPLLMKINSLLKTELFPNYQYEMGMGVKISFTVQVLKFVYDADIIWLSIIILVLVLISLSFIADVIVWIKALIENRKIRNDEVYIPYTPSKLGKRQNPYIYTLLKTKQWFPESKIEKAYIGHPEDKQ